MTRFLFFAATLAIAAGAQAQAVRLQLKFPQGRTDRMTLKMHVAEVIAVHGQPKPMVMGVSQTMTMLTRVVKSSSQGASVRTTYEDMTQTMSMNGQSMPSGMDAGKALKGKSLTLNFSPGGKIVGVEGVAALKAALENGGSPGVQQMIGSMFTDKSVRDQWTASLGGLFPNRPLRVGESWNTTLPLSQGPFQILLKLKMKLVGVRTIGGRRMAQMSMSGTGSMAGSGPGMAGAKFTSDKLDVSGASSFDLDRGWFGGQSMFLDAKLNVVVPNQPGQSASVKMKMTMNTIVTPVR